MLTKQLSLILFSFAGILSAQAPRHELALTLGQVRAQDRLPIEPLTATSGVSPTLFPPRNTPIQLSSGSAFQANYGLRIAGGDAVAVYIGGHLLASPQRKVTSQITFVPRDFASLYLAPHITLKLAAGSRFSPWGTFGGGYALYEQSTTRINGASFVPRHVHKGAWLVGGGVDIKLVRWLALRGEVRDFFTGGPELDVVLQKSGQHNIVVGGGFVLRF